ncbi:MAG: MqnA/MqnD/SBP family protein [Planctomycetota bacterium]
MPDDRPNLRLAHSPDSDDMVMWWPLVGLCGPGGVPVEGDLGEPSVLSKRVRFEPMAEDVEALNKRAADAGDLDITAVSAASWPAMRDRYLITACGGSFGEGYGPKLVCKGDDGRFAEGDLSALTRPGFRLAVPGVGTTAYLTLRLMLGGRGFVEGLEPIEMPFYEVPDAVRTGRVDAGLLIHEAQLTFEAEGLRKLADVGEWWTEDTGLPLPLGLNVIRRDLDDRLGRGVGLDVAITLEASIRHARANPEACRQLLLLHSEGRPEWQDQDLVERYLSMYVSDLTVNMGAKGKQSLELLYERGADEGLVDPVESVDIVGL